MSSEHLASQFEQERSRLRAVATGILGSPHEADDTVQDAWFRCVRADIDRIDNLSGWLTVVVSRIALDHVRARNRRREIPIDSSTQLAFPAEGNAEASVEFEESIYEALTYALDRLSPLETATFVLHDLFGLPFDEVSHIVDRSPEATRKLASRARQKVANGTFESSVAKVSHRAIVEAFFVAAQSGDLNALITLLAPDAVLRADQAAVQFGIQPEFHGAAEIAGELSGKAQAARIAWIEGKPGGVWAHRGEIRAVFGFAFKREQIQEIWLRADQDYLKAVEIEIEPPAKRRSAGANDRSGA